MPGPRPGLVPQPGTHAPRACPRLLAGRVIRAHRNVLRRDRGLAAWPEPRRARRAEGQLSGGSFREQGPPGERAPGPRVGWRGPREV